MSSVCAVKKLYDTEFEATVAASKATSAFGTEMVAYPCNQHWHIANKNPELRSKNRKFEQTYCPECRAYMKKGRWSRHQTTVGHRKNKQKETP